MKTVPIISWNHPWGIVQNFARAIGEALTRAGFNVIHLCQGTADLAKYVELALAEPEIAFVFSLGTFPIFNVNDRPIWQYFNARTFIYFLDPPIYELRLPQTWDLLRENTGRVVLGLTDNAYRRPIHATMRAAGGRGHTMFLPVATFHNQPRPTTAWRDRPMDIMYFGSVGSEVMTHHIRDEIPESFAAYRNSFVPFEALVEGVSALLLPGAAGNAVTHMMARLGAGPQVLGDPRWINLLGEVDSFVKRYRKIQIARNLAGHKLHLFGHGWDFAKDIPGFVVHGPLANWNDHFELYHRSKIVLNIDPNMEYAASDRAYTTAAQGAVVLTQDNSYINLILEDECLTYDQSGIGAGEVVSRAGSDLAEMAAAGLMRARAHHTWDHRVRELVEYLGELG